MARRVAMRDPRWWRQRPSGSRASHRWGRNLSVEGTGGNPMETPWKPHGNPGGKPVETMGLTRKIGGWCFFPWDSFLEMLGFLGDLMGRSPEITDKCDHQMGWWRERAEPLDRHQDHFFAAAPHVFLPILRWTLAQGTTNQNEDNMQEHIARLLVAANNMNFQLAMIQYSLSASWTWSYFTAQGFPSFSTQHGSNIPTCATSSKIDPPNAHCSHWIPPY